MAMLHVYWPPSGCGLNSGLRITDWLNELISFARGKALVAVRMDGMLIELIFDWYLEDVHPDLKH